MIYQTFWSAFEEAPDESARGASEKTQTRAREESDQRARWLGGQAAVNFGTTLTSTREERDQSEASPGHGVIPLGTVAALRTMTETREENDPIRPGFAALPRRTGADTSAAAATTGA